MASCFAFLPHVRVQAEQEITVGPFILWRNSPVEWFKRFGVDNTALFEIYRDEGGNPVGENASILSKPDHTEAPYEEFRDAVYCLSSAVWVLGHGSSDPWVFERWLVEVPTPPDYSYRRASKFSVNHTSANYDRVYPTPYTHRIDLSPYNDQEAIAYFAQEMAKPRKESMLTAFSHFHLARFDTQYFTSPGDSIESMWSGFESLLEIDTFGSVPTSEKQEPDRHGFWGTVGEKRRLIFECPHLATWAALKACIRSFFQRTILVGERRTPKSVTIRQEHPERVGKDEKLLRALHAELEKYNAGWCPEFWNGIAAWVEPFYKERNHHSHGVRGDLAAETIEPYGLSAFSIAIHLAQAILNLRWRGENPLFAASTAGRLNSLFLFAPILRGTVDIIRKHDRKIWYPGTGSMGAQLTTEMLRDFELDLVTLVKLESSSRLFYRNVHVAQARQKMGLVLSNWVSDLLKQPPSTVELGPVSAIPSTIAALLSNGKSNDEIDTQLALDLLACKAGNADVYGPGASVEPRLLLRNKVPIWLWVDAYIKLTEAWLGYPLR